MNRVALEMELITATRLTRALWLALRGLADSNKRSYPSDEDLSAVEELAWHASLSATRTEKALFEGEGRQDAAKT